MKGKLRDPARACSRVVVNGIPCSSRVATRARADAARSLRRSVENRVRRLKGDAHEVPFCREGVRTRLRRTRRCDSVHGPSEFSFRFRRAGPIRGESVARRATSKLPWPPGVSSPSSFFVTVAAELSTNRLRRPSVFFFFGFSPPFFPSVRTMRKTETPSPPEIVEKVRGRI